MRNALLSLVFLGILPAVSWADDARPERPPAVEDLLASMDEAEVDYYFNTFNYAMEAVKPGKRHAWKTYSSAGWMELDPAFERNGTVCRNFREHATFAKQYNADGEGVGCRRVGREGWCRLARGEMQTCALEPPRSGYDAIMESVNDMGRKLERKSTKANSLWYHYWPF